MDSRACLALGSLHDSLLVTRGVPELMFTLNRTQIFNGTQSRSVNLEPSEVAWLAFRITIINIIRASETFFIIYSLIKDQNLIF